MKSRILNLIAMTALLMALGLATVISVTPASSVKAANPEMATAGDAKARRLEGTWLVQVTLRNCQTGDALRTFPAFLTFAQGGTLIETTTALGSAQRSPGHGFWEHTGGKSFKAVSKAFLFNPDGTSSGIQTITQTIEFGDDPDVFNSNATTEIAAPNGNVIMSGCATAVAHRMD